MARVLLVDDQAMFRDCLKKAIEEEPDLHVGAEAGTAEAMRQYMKQAQFDVVILDIRLPDASGLSLLPQIRESYPDTRVIMVSQYTHAAYARHAISNGASGYVVKDSSYDELLRAIRMVTQGHMYICSKVLPDFMDGLKQTEGRTLIELLSDREFEVLTLIGRGLSLKEIGQRMGISMKTVSTYRSRLLEKLKLHTNADLVKFALESGLV